MPRSDESILTGNGICVKLPKRESLVDNEITF